MTKIEPMDIDPVVRTDDVPRKDQIVVRVARGHAQPSGQRVRLDRVRFNKDGQIDLTGLRLRRDGSTGNRVYLGYSNTRETTRGSRPHQAGS